MNLRSLFLTLAVVAAVCAKAEIITVMFYTVDGRKIGYTISEKPVCKYTDNNTRLLVATASDKVDYDVADLQKFVFTGEVVKVENAKAAQGSFSNKSGLLSFEGYKAGTSVAVYSADGVLVEKAVANTAGQAKLSLQNRPKGVYIVKAGKTSIKITKQ